MTKRVKRKVSAHIEGREKQRKAILNSAAFLSGKPFTRADAASVIRMSAVQAHNLLRAMIDDGLVGSFVAGYNGGRPVIHYCKPLPKILRQSWRRHSNSELGIEDAA